MKFKEFAALIKKQFEKMAKNDLFVVDIQNDVLWEEYLNAFPEGTNNLFKERREYDCNCCKTFIRGVGKVVSIKNGKLETIWDVPALDHFKVVADKMSSLIKDSLIASPYLSVERAYGKDESVVMLENGKTHRFYHYRIDLPSSLVNQNKNSLISEMVSSHGVFKRGLEEITPESSEIVLDLIDQKSIYRGEEFERGIKDFQKLQKKYLKLKTTRAKELFTWENYKSSGARIRNTAIGTLLQDLSEGMDIDRAVTSFESKVAPQNYKRTSALITKSMIKKATETLEKLGLEPSLYRRFATLEDVSINNVLFADRSVTAKMKDSLEHLLSNEVKVNEKSFDKVQEIGIEEFVSDVLPNVQEMELFIENKHSNNFVSLTAPKDPNAQGLFLWNNGFAWAYNGDVTDSIKEKVKRAGGAIEGDLRVSLNWFNTDDLDVHVGEPRGHHIYYGSKCSFDTGGKLDVDMNVSNPVRDAVENVVWQDRKRMQEGDYIVYVDNYTKRESRDVGFVIEIEFDGQIHTLSYNRAVSASGKVKVCSINFKDGKFTLKNIHKDITASGVSKEIWGLNTQSFVKVNNFMYSPNFWDDQQIGNKHYMFMIDECINPDSVRGFYNEFLKTDLIQHRKVFEILGSKLKCEHTNNQLSGLGFSSTQRNEIICRVKGNFTRTLKIQF